MYLRASDGFGSRQEVWLEVGPFSIGEVGRGYAVLILGNLPSYRLRTPFLTVSNLDFSHLPAKKLEIRSSSQCATSANQGAYRRPTTDHDDALYAPFTPLFSKRLFQHVQDSH